MKIVKSCAWECKMLKNTNGPVPQLRCLRWLNTSKACSIVLCRVTRHLVFVTLMTRQPKPWICDRRAHKQTM